MDGGFDIYFTLGVFMSSPQSFKRGDIILVDLSGAMGGEKMNDAKINGRPCVVVQNDRGNAVSPLTIIAPITGTDQFKNLPVQVLVTAAELGPGGSDSVVECGHVRTIDLRRVLKQLGTLTPAAMQRVDKALKISLSV